jgi:hypothetical protein
MNITGIAVVRNEQDIVEPFVRHNLRYLDRLLITDNASIDATKAILAVLANELGPRLTVSHDDSFVDALSIRAMFLLRQCNNSDYVVPLDADEFISAPDRQRYEAALSTIPSGGFGIVPWRTFVIRCDPTTDIDPPRTIRRYRTFESPQFSKVIVNMRGHSDLSDLVLSTGSHEVLAPSGRHMPSIVLASLLDHYPVRSRDQIIGKGVVGWMAFAALKRNARELNENYHKREVFDLIAAQNGKGILPDETLARMSMLYAQNGRPYDWDTDTTIVPSPFDYERKYSTGKPMPPMPLILKSWEQWVAR